MNGASCPAEDFLTTGEATTEGVRAGLVYMLEHVAQNGLQNVPQTWFHEANKQDQIYEFSKGPLRLFFFKGQGKQIAVCTAGVRKSGKKADKQEVAKAAKFRAAYFKTLSNNTLQVIFDDNE